MVVADFYTNGEYLQKNPDWHEDAAPWKAESILAMMQRNALLPKSTCEIGCGSGGILSIIQQSLPSDCTFEGYDIAPQAIEMAKTRENDRLHFHLGDFFATKELPHFDLILFIDVLEHFENCFQILRDVRPKSTYKILQLPLDISARSVLKNELIDYRHTTGHLHFFTKDIALEILRDAGYEVIDYYYSLQPLDPEPWSKAKNPTRALYKLIRLAKRALIRLPSQLCYAIKPDFAVRAFGGWRLVVLIK